MVRIGIDARSLVDFGIGTYVRGLLEGLAAIETDEQYVVFGPAEARERIPKVYEFRETAAPRYSIRELVQVGTAIRRARLDLFHAPHFVIPFTQCPVVVTLHDAIPFRYPVPNPIAWPYIFIMTRRAARHARRILTVSEAARHDLVDILDCDAEKIAVTYNGIDELYFRPGPAAARYGRYFLYVGNTGTHKNVGALVEAIARVRESESDVSLVLAGARHDEFSTNDGVVRAGFVTRDDLAALYRGAVALVMPSFIEGFGLPAAEAMACGTAVITSTAPALVEVTANAALHVDPRSPRALADAMLKLLREPRLRETLGARGRARAAAFTWERCARATRAEYLKAIGTRAS